MTPWQNCRVTRARRKTERLALLPALGVWGVLLAATSACSPAAGGSGGDASAGAAAPSAPASAVAAGPEAPAAAPDPATAAAKVRVEGALATVTTSGSIPGTDQIRAAIAQAGFPSAAIEVTASRTPTGLAADAVEAAVRQDRYCVVAQLRNGTVAVTVLPVLANGRCLVGWPT